MSSRDEAIAMVVENPRILYDTLDTYIDHDLLEPPQQVLATVMILAALVEANYEAEHLEEILTDVCALLRDLVAENVNARTACNAGDLH